MKKDYMARLERAARWRLPPQEAEDVIADYRDIVGNPPRPEEELIRNLGKPADVIRPLVQKKPYYTWLAVFAVMAACVIVLGHSGFGWYSWTFYRLCFDKGGPQFGPLVALLGGVTSLVWFRRRKDETKSPVPKGIIATLIVLLVWIGLVLLFHWAILHDRDGFLNLWGMMEPPIGPRENLVSRSLELSTWAMSLLPFFLSFLALYWLVKARVSDRRWTAVYILALAAIVVSMETLALTVYMEPLPVEVGFRDNLIKCAVITAVGLVGTGWPYAEKDLIQLCLLHLLSQGDQYGYDLLRRLHAAFPDTQESAVYALLRLLCREGRSSSTWAPSPTAPARKYYRLTDQGLARYGELLKQWRALLAALAELGVT